jgi:hypothetical protein
MSFNLILHIGRHKSGTSALQIALDTNRGLLESKGVLYPKAGAKGKTAHHDLAYALNSKFKRNDYLELIGMIKEEIKEHHHTVIISSEAFQNIHNMNRVNILVETLKPDNTTIICYFREYADYCIASFSQRIQAQPAFITFQNQVDDMKGLSITTFIERWVSVGTFKMYWFDRNKLINLDIVDDFFNRIGFAGYLSDLEKCPYNPNPSIGGNLLFLKNAANYLRCEFISYQSMSKLAATFAAFRVPMYLATDHVEFLRDGSNYNNYLIEHLGPIDMKDWSDNPPIPNNARLQADIDKLYLFAPGADKELIQKIAHHALEDVNWFSIVDYK